MKNSEDKPWTTLLLRSLAGASFSVPVGLWLGPAAGMISVAFWVPALAPPLLGVTASAWQQLRARSYRDVMGIYYEHAGQAIEVIEDDDARWLRAAQIQRVLGDRAREAVFAHRFGAEGCRLGPRGRWYVRDDDLLDYLEQSASARDARRNGLRLFVLREVRNPHRHRRGRRPSD